MIRKCSKELYCQFLIAAQTNFTATGCSSALPDTAHDSVTRFLSERKLTPNILWEYARKFVHLDSGVLIVDDTVLDHPYGEDIELVRWQYSGTHHDVVRGIGVTTLLWSTSTLEEHIPTDFRIYSPQDDGKTKNGHCREMLKKAHERGIIPQWVVMDSFYGSVDTLHLINDFGWVFVSGVKSNRLVYTAPGRINRFSVCQVDIPPEGRIVHLKDYGKVKLFQLVATNGKVEYLVTNDLSASLEDVREAYAVRWKIEEYHRGLKQTTGIEACQSRTARSQRNHVFCSLLSFLALEKKRLEEGTTWYESKRRIIADALFSYLKSPFVQLPVSGD